MTEGFEVFVQEVIAAITTAPCARYTTWPSSSQGTPAVHVGTTATGAGESPAARGPGGAGVGVRGRVARGERLGVRLVHGVAVFDTEGSERLAERGLRPCERDPVLRATRAGERGLDRREVELDDLRVRRRLRGVVPEHVLLAVRLDERDPLVAAPGEAQVAECLLVDREEPTGRAVLGRHVPDRRAVGQRQAGEALAEVLDELPDDAGVAEDLRHRQDEVGRGRALRELPVEAEADDLRQEHRHRLAEHRGLGLDPADAPADDAQAVDHRRVRVGADERVGERLPVALLDDTRQELEVHLVADADVRRDDLERVEGALAPPQERVALAVAVELELRVPLDREPAREVVDLHRVVDHELRRGPAGRSRSGRRRARPSRRASRRDRPRQGRR